MNSKILILTLTMLGMMACSNQNIPNTPNIVNGTLPGKFSVGPSKVVQFSQGNLQYSSNVWRFAEQQYCIGDIGWTELFSWGEDNDQLTAERSFVDWGVHPISNGGDMPNIWHTLSMKEWVYLFHERTNAEILFGFGSVNHVKGVIVLPDEWIQPEDVPTFYAGIAKGLTWETKCYLWNNNELFRCWYDNINKGNSDIFSHNSYSALEWLKMESAGAVFLPAAGNNGQPAGKYGDYWSSTPDKEYYDDFAFCLSFCQQGLFPMGSANFNYLFSVRLVR